MPQAMAMPSPYTTVFHGDGLAIATVMMQVLSVRIGLFLGWVLEAGLEPKYHSSLFPGAGRYLY